MTVSVAIVGGPTAKVEWTSGMTAQQALELAEVALGSQFLFSLEYYGELGYLVNMINETYDTFASSSSPFFYWEFLVNGTMAAKGIDQTVLNDGDVVGFLFTTYDQAAASKLTTAKHKRRSLPR